ncbi:glutamate receptor 2.3-like [Apium graveolens]|uniref:glutamate receptor 2.3-like n=1 Tax=Apium graveolens TaxID=4045 RepID=UPI003D78F879
MKFSNLYLHLLFISTIVVFLASAKNETNTTLPLNNEIVDVGLILDFSSSAGFIANSCISMALSDFYSKNQQYNTRLALHSKNSDDITTAASAALELVNEDQVVAIIGPQHSNEARFVAEIGGISQVPIISFSMTSSSNWPSKTPYFIQTTLPDSSQLECISSLVQQLGWHEIVVIYEDDTEKEPDNSFISSVIQTFQKASIQLFYTITISSSAGVSVLIKKELSHLRSIQTRVFLVHVTSTNLVSHLFSIANEVGMMRKGTTWIITDALSNLLSSLDATTIESMEGVLGIRPYIPQFKNIKNFKVRWNNLLLVQQQPNVTEKIRDEFTMVCLRAYDTVWALATVVENIQFPEVKRSNEKFNTSSAITNLRISEAGPRLVKEILETRFLGLSGEFKLNHRQIETKVVEIINIAGNGESGARTVGYWTPGSGFSRKIASESEKNYEVVPSKPVDLVLRPIIWPGDSTTKPKGWDVPGMGLKLRVGVPKKTGFKEFVNVQEIGDTKKYNVTGFSIDVFNAALDALPFKLEPEFIPFINDRGESNGTYNDLINKLSGTKNLEYDVVVGDVTIWALREEMVDFSLPYTESGVGILVRSNPKKQNNMWIFLKPLSWDLWLSVFLATIFIGIVLRMLERGLNPQRQLGMLFLFPVAALAFPERNMVGNKWARFVLVLWLFMAYILMQSYTANLSSILTVDQLRPSAYSPECAGYQEGSFVKDVLTEWFSMNITDFPSYRSIEAYDEALSLGCKNGGVDAIFDEIPYIKLFLSKYSPKYKMSETTYNTGGFGFAFPTGSPLSKPMSKAIFSLRESGRMRLIERRYFEVGRTSKYEAEDASQINPSLTTSSFAGLFIVTALLTLLTRYRVHSLMMTHDVRGEIDLQDHKEYGDNIKDDDQISATEIIRLLNADHGFMD